MLGLFCGDALPDIMLAPSKGDYLGLSRAIRARAVKVEAGVDSIRDPSVPR